MEDDLNGMQHCWNPTNLNMEEDLNCFENGRLPHLVLKMEEDLFFLQIVEDLNFSLSKERQPQYT